MARRASSNLLRLRRLNRHSGDGMTQTAKELAQKANVGVSTVQRIENAAGPPNAYGSNLASIQSALEAAGIEFTNGDAPGIRMRGKRAAQVR